MGRMKPSWYYERQAKEANDREAYFTNRNPTPPTGTIKTRGAATEAYYRSMLVKDRANSRIFKVQVDVEAPRVARVAYISALNGLSFTLTALLYNMSIFGEQ